jgi:hypothetical protein
MVEPRVTGETISVSNAIKCIVKFVPCGGNRSSVTQISRKTVKFGSFIELQVLLGLRLTKYTSLY